jgi:hypothetical protein
MTTPLKYRLLTMAEMDLHDWDAALDCRIPADPPEELLIKANSELDRAFTRLFELADALMTKEKGLPYRTWFKDYPAWKM